MVMCPWSIAMPTSVAMMLFEADLMLVARVATAPLK
jgi:type III secretory pathway component EscT